MCGRFTSTASPEELMRSFGVTVMDNLQPRWNVAPSQSSLVIVQTGLQPEAVFPHWGLPPGGQGRSFLINARMETAAEKPTFRQAFANRRCLVVASGWYEWSGQGTVACPAVRWRCYGFWRAAAAAWRSGQVRGDDKCSGRGTGVNPSPGAPRAAAGPLAGMADRWSGHCRQPVRCRAVKLVQLVSGRGRGGPGRSRSSRTRHAAG